MEFYEAVRRRTTAREWTPQDVEEDVLKRILEAGLRAPSNDHLRSWEFIVLRTEEEKENALRFVREQAEKQAETVRQRFAQPAGERPAPVEAARQMYAYSVPRQYRMLREAPWVVIPFFRAAPGVLKPEAVNHLNSFASVWCVVENMMLAAAAEGLAVSVRIPVGEEGPAVSRLLNVPAPYMMPCYLGFGHPAEDAPVLTQNRPSLGDRIHRGEW